MLAVHLRLRLGLKSNRNDVIFLLLDNNNGRRLLLKSNRNDVIFHNN